MVQLLAADVPRLAAQNYFGGAVDTSGGLPFTKQGKTLAFLEITVTELKWLFLFFISSVKYLLNLYVLSAIP